MQFMKIENFFFHDLLKDKLCKHTYSYFNLTHVVSHIMKSFGQGFE